MATIKVSDLVEEIISTTNARSAWNKGVVEYALDILDGLDEVIVLDGDKYHQLKEICLNGSENWNQYSWNGCSLIYDSDIAERLCTPSELKKTKYGERRPNSKEDWLDVQARALKQAFRLIWLDAWIMIRSEEN